MTKRKILFITHSDDFPWERQIPDSDTIRGDNIFTFDPRESDVDWIVVYAGLPENLHLRHNASKTLFVSGEPPSIHKYNAKFLHQFARVVSVDESLTGENILHGQMGLPWHAGVPVGKIDEYANAMTYSELKRPIAKKTKLASVVCSSKAFIPFHRKRIDFVFKLQSALGNKIDFFGRGIREIDDKEYALRDYRYHIAIENAQIPHYFTEKITDSFLREAYPIYCGAPNIHDYFPPDSCALFDISDTDESINRIRNILDSDMDKENRAAVRKAKKLCLEKYNIFPMIISHIEEMESRKMPDEWRDCMYKEPRTLNSLARRITRRLRHHAYNSWRAKP